MRRLGLVLIALASSACQREAPAPCDPGRLGCVCTPDDRCTGAAATCVRGACFGPGFPVPGTYFYAEQQIHHDAAVTSELILDWLRERMEPGETVVDIGTGDGFAALFAAERVGRWGRVIATDIDPARLERVVRKLAAAPELASTVELRRVESPGDTALGDLPAASVDWVWMLRVLTFVPREREANLRYLEQIARVTRPGGRFVYLMDWFARDDARKTLFALAREAGFAGGIEEIPLPPHIPPETSGYPWNRGPSESALVPYYRGGAWVFTRSE
jgi:SAM-dependent methyltransferase